MRKQNTTYVYILVGTLIVLFSFGRRGFAQEEYRIGVDDVLSISVWETPNLNLEVAVRPDGMISFPLLDDIPAEGKTPLELKAYLTERLSPFIKDPIVTVIVRSFNSQKVYIQGEVVKPGSYPFRERFTLAEVIAMAGGIKSGSADYLKSFIMREGKKLDVDFYRLFREGDISQNVVLKPNDTIFIPDNFSSRLTVLGFVVNPGSINYRKGMTVLDAILSAKGFSKRADLESTTVIRKTNGKEERIEVDMEAVMEEGDMEKNILLLPADKIIVKEKWY